MSPLCVHCILVVVGLHCSLSMADNSTSDSALKAGMEPFFSMMNNFLDVVQPVSKGTIMDYVFVNGTFSIVPEQINYQQITYHYVGYAACVVAGVLFILIMPFAGCIICCCRCCCKKCGGKPGKRRKHDKWKRRICGSILFIITTIMLAGCICAFLANELTREQTASDDNDSMISSLNTKLSDLAEFLKNTVKQATDKVNDVFNRIQQLVNSFGDLPQKVRNAVAQFGNIDDITNSGLNLGNLSIKLNATLTVIEQHSEKLKQLGSQLASNLSDIARDLQAICSQQSCGSELNNTVYSLSTVANFSNVDSVSEKLARLHDIANANLTGLIQQGIGEFNSMMGQVSSDTEDALADTNNTVTTVRRQVDLALNETQNLIKEVSYQLSNASQQITSYKDQINQYGNYRFYGFIGLCCMILLVVFFLYLGLCVGVCTKAPDEMSGSCNRGVGANLLVAGVTFMFLFCWLLMIITIVLFLVGGLIQTEACRYVVDLKASPLLAVIERQIEKQFPTVSINFSSAIESCSSDKSLSYAINLDSMFNVSKRLDLETYGFSGQFDNINNISINFSNIHIFSNQTKQQLIALRDSGLDNINLTSYDMQLSRNLTSTDLLSLANSLNALAVGKSADMATRLNTSAENLRAVHYQIVSLMLIEKVQLSNAVQFLKNEKQNSGLFAIRTQKLMDSLQAADDSVHNNGTKIIRQFVSNVTSEVYNKMKNLAEDLLNWLLNDFARCGPLYKIVTGCINIVCVNILYPINSYWFGLGWCLFFYIPSVIVALFLATVYRRAEYDYDSDKDMDDPAYWWLNEKQTRQGLLSRKPQTRII